MAAHEGPLPSLEKAFCLHERASACPQKEWPALKRGGLPSKEGACPHMWVPALARGTFPHKNKPALSWGGLPSQEGTRRKWSQIATNFMTGTGNSKAKARPLPPAPQLRSATPEKFRSANAKKLVPTCRLARTRCTRHPVHAASAKWKYCNGKSSHD